MLSVCWSIIPLFQLSTAVLFVAFLGYKYSTYHYGRWKKLGVSHAEPVPLFGNFREILTGKRSLTRTVHALYRRFDDQRYFGMYEARNPVLVVRDPDLIHAVMVKDFGSFHDRNAGKVSFKHDTLFDHLVNLRGEQWKSIRTKLSPTFSAVKLKMMLADMNECTMRLIDSLNEQMTENDGVVNISEASAQFTTDTIGRCAFGLDCNALTDADSEFRRVGRDVFKPSRRSMTINFIRLVGLGRLIDLFRVRSLSNHIYEFFDRLFETTMKQHKTEENNRNDFVSLLIKLKKDEEQNKNEEKLFTDDILTANAFVFFVAGFETTASTISYCLYELALNPDIQNTLREKIKQTLDENDGKLSYDTLKGMKYLDMVINETMRIHPPVPVLLRVCTKKYTIPDSDITLNCGEKVMIPTYSLHNDPKYYPNPEKFDPERFNEDNKNSRPHGTFLPFGDGPRICIGLRFAMMEVKTGLAEILSKFEVMPCEDTEIPIKISPRSIVLLTPSVPIRLKLKKC